MIPTVFSVAALLCLVCTCSAAVLETPVLEDSTFQNETAIQVDWQFDASAQPISHFIVMATGKFFDTVTREKTIEASGRSLLLTELKSGETYAISVLVVNGTDNSTSREIEVNTMVFSPEIETVSSSLSTLSFRWSLPDGEMAKSFNLNLSLEGVLNFDQKELDGNTFDVTYYNLSSSSNYEISVFNVGYNDEFIFSSAFYSTDIPDIRVGVVSISNTQFTINWWAEDLLYLAGPFLVEYYGENIDTLNRNITVDANDRSTDVTGLISGETYVVTVSMSTRVSTKTSNLTYITTALGTPTFNNRSQTTTTFTLSWTSNNGFVEFYVLTYEGVDIETRQQVLTVPGSDSETTITTLLTGVEYRVEIVAYSNNQFSPSDTIRISTTPNPVEDLVVTFNETGHLRADWDAPSVGFFENYEVEVHNSTSLVITDTTYANGYEYFDPDPEETYTVYVTVLAKDGERSIQKFARNGVTTSVGDIVYEVNQTSIRLMWTPPTDTYTLVRVTCGSCSNDKVQDFYTNDVPDCIYTNLSPGVAYFITFETFLNEESISETIALLPSTIPDTPTVESANSAGLDFIVVTLSDATCTSCKYIGQPTSELGQTLGSVTIEPESSQTTFDMRFDQLQPGTRYNISVVAERNGVLSLPAEIVQQTTLAQATNIIKKANTTAVMLSWTPPQGLYDMVTVSCFCGVTHTRTSDAEQLVVFSELNSGSSEFVTVHTERQGFEDSTKEIFLIYTVPEPAEDVNILHVTTSSITVQIRDHDCTGCFYHVTAMSSDLDNHTVVMHDRLASVSIFDVELIDLYPGTEYFIQVVAEIEGLRSSPFNITATTTPIAIEDIRFSQITSSGFTMFWDKPEGDFDGYVITLQPSDSEIPTLSEFSTYYTFKDLLPYTEYTVTLAAVAGTSPSADTVGTITTSQGIPGPVTNVAAKQSESTIVVTFNPPLEVFGVIEAYTINKIGEFPGLPSDSDVRLLNAHQTVVAYENLLAGYNYTFVIQAKNADNIGVSAYISSVIPPNEPEPSTMKPEKVAENSITNSSFTVSINDLLFSEDNGPVSTFVIIVAEQQAIGDSKGGETGAYQDATLPSWGQVINNNPTPRYQTSEPIDYSIVRNAGNRKKRATDVTINVGSVDCSAASATTFCNGPLKPGKTYVYQFRGYYNTDYYSDTLYSEPITLNSENDGKGDSEEKDKEVVIISIVLGLIILLLIGVMIILVYSYRTKNKVLRTIVGKDGTFREAPTTRADVNLVSMKIMKPEERWDLNFAQFESNFIQERKGSANTSIENLVEIGNGHVGPGGIENEIDIEETSFTLQQNEMSNGHVGTAGMEGDLEIGETSFTLQQKDNRDSTDVLIENNIEMSNGHAKTEELIEDEDKKEDASVAISKSTIDIE
ncbi:fibronectin-like isoform X2 [Antedon mediterranea]|uniref:fibronectin-like isoform X2 n=1 Tax=Antedon mediterranea TaxID=105859 RepID=UPI003AF8383E